MPIRPVLCSVSRRCRAALPWGWQSAVLLWQPSPEGTGMERRRPRYRAPVSRFKALAVRNRCSFAEQCLWAKIWARAGSTRPFGFFGVVEFERTAVQLSGFSDHGDKNRLWRGRTCRGFFPPAFASRLRRGKQPCRSRPHADAVGVLPLRDAGRPAFAAPSAIGANRVEP